MYGYYLDGSKVVVYRVLPDLDKIKKFKKRELRRIDKDMLTVLDIRQNNRIFSEGERTYAAHALNYGSKKEINFLERPFYLYKEWIEAYLEKYLELASPGEVVQVKDFGKGKYYQLLGEYQLDIENSRFKREGNLEITERLNLLWEVWKSIKVQDYSSIIEKDFEGILSLFDFVTVGVYDLSDIVLASQVGLNPEDAAQVIRKVEDSTLILKRVKK